MPSLLLTPLPGAATPTLCSEILLQACQSQLPQWLAATLALIAASSSLLKTGPLIWWLPPSHYQLHSLQWLLFFCKPSCLTVLMHLLPGPLRTAIYLIKQTAISPLTRNSTKRRGRVDDLSFFDYLSSFCFLLIEFHCTFTISYKILPDYVHYYCILIRMCDRPSGLLLFMPAVLFSILTPLLSVFVCLIVLFHSCCSHAWVVGKTLKLEFPLSYSHTEWYFLISLFGAREYKNDQRTLL